MPQPDPVTSRQIPLIQQIIRDETWFEGERRGCYVPPDDPVVRDNVCQVVLRVGRKLREELTADLARQSQGLTRAGEPRRDEAA